MKDYEGDDGNALDRLGMRFPLLLASDCHADAEQKEKH